MPHTEDDKGWRIKRLDLTKKVAIVHFKSKLFACSGQWGMGDGRWEMEKRLGKNAKFFLMELSF